MSTSPKPAHDSELYIGLMSGTSLDGVDGVLVQWDGAQPQQMRVLAYAAQAFPAALRQELLTLNSPNGANELHRAALAGNAISRAYADVVMQLLQQSSATARQVRAMGAHGQTVRHQPQLHDGTGYTLQLQNPALLAELTGIAVVADLRSRDVAAGGQGAPLVPAFHQGVFSRAGQATVVLNIGGIANLSVLPAHSTPATPVSGFDCGPGNALMDWWCLQHTGASYDDQGRWAAGGVVHPALLTRLLAEPFLQQPPPKSTGRDLFNPTWLQAQLQAVACNISPQDVQATLTAFTAHSCADAVLRYGQGSNSLLVCGGGALNAELMRQLQALLPQAKVESTTARGLPPLQVEATAFAWLARQCMHGLPGNLPVVTGAQGPRILGAIYPA
ncbi:MAG: anhydro-N-acetylmuramic acid kinase [Comamonas sp.]